MPKSHILTAIFFIAALTCVDSLLSNSLDLYNTSEVSLSKILPADIAFIEVESISMLEQDETSSIYEIVTHDGRTVYQVVAMAVVRAIPGTISAACLVVIKHPTVCRMVYLSGQALIRMKREAIYEKITDFWQTKITGENGIAAITAKSWAEAKDGQLAFSASKEQAKFPWEPALIREYGDLSNRFSGKAESDAKVNNASFFNRRMNGGRHNLNAVAPTILIATYVDKLLSGDDPILVGNILTQFKNSLAGRAKKLYLSENISQELDAQLRTMYRIPNDHIIVGAYDDISWGGSWFVDPFNEGMVFTDKRLAIRTGSNTVGWLDYKTINNECTISWSDDSIYIKNKDEEYWSASIADSEITPVEMAKLIDDLAYAIANN